MFSENIKAFFENIKTFSKQFNKKTKQLLCYKNLLFSDPSRNEFLTRAGGLWSLSWSLLWSIFLSVSFRTSFLCFPIQIILFIGLSMRN